jgi:hypothetical protein
VTISARKPLNVHEWAAKPETAATLDEYAPDRPHVLGDCYDFKDADGHIVSNGVNAMRPCPWATCEFHMAVEINRAGGLRVMKGWDETDEKGRALRPTCLIDLALEGGMSLEEVGRVFGIVRERVRQIESSALRKLRKGGVDLRQTLSDLRRQAAEEPSGPDTSNASKLLENFENAIRFSSDF